MSQPPTAAPRPRLRWWPLLLILLGTAAALAWLWWRPAPTRQYQVKRTLRVLQWGALAVPLWWLFLCGLRLRVRVVGALLMVAFGLLVRFLFPVRGVTGDLWPIPEWRWAAHPAAVRSLAPTAPPPPATTAEPSAADYGQFLGPDRDGHVTSVRLDPDWQAHPPRELWRQPVGEGWSAFAVAGDDAVTQEQRGAKELVVCYDRSTGQVRWSHADETRFASDQAGVGPRATPTLTATRVLSVGATGRLNCLRRDDGVVLWSKDLIGEHGAEPPRWGMASSPLVVGDRVIAVAGGPAGHSLVAYALDDGRLVWSGGDAPAGYSSPQLRTLAGVEQVLVFQQGGVFAHAPDDGRVLWQVPWPPVGTEAIAQPVVLPDDRVLVASGYGVGARLFQVHATDDGSLQAEFVWRSLDLKPKFTNVQVRDGHAYGLDDGMLACIELRRGRRVWKEGRYGHGQMLRVDDLLLIQAESGEVVLVRATPEGLDERARFAALDGKTWNSPALAGGTLLVRNDREAACFELPVLPPR